MKQVFCSILKINLVHRAAHAVLIVVHIFVHALVVHVAAEWVPSIFKAEEKVSISTTVGER